MRSPVAMSNGWAPVLASYSAITLFTSSMSAVAGSYSRIVVSPWDENVKILAFIIDLPRMTRGFLREKAAENESLKLIMRRCAALSRYDFPGHDRREVHV